MHIVVYKCSNIIVILQDGVEDKEDMKSEEPAIEQPFQQIFISCPDGLNIKYMLESHIGMRPISEDDRRLLVKQSYPYKTNGQQACESARKKYALSEVSRVITSEGTVIKNMVDGSIQVNSSQAIRLVLLVILTISACQYFFILGA